MISKMLMMTIKMKMKMIDLENAEDNSDDNFSDKRNARHSDEYSGKQRQAEVANAN